MVQPLGRAVLGLSGMGFPLTQMAIKRFNRPGAVLVEGVCAGLVIRDAALIANGTPRRLRKFPAALLWLEIVAGVAAVIIGVLPVIDDKARERALAQRPVGLEVVRRIAVGALFGLHTWRFRIYLQPDSGRRPVS